MNRVQLGIWVSTAAILLAQLLAASPLTATEKEDTKIDQVALDTYLEQYGDVDLLAVALSESKTDSSVELLKQHKEQPTLIAQTPEVLVPNPKITIEDNAAPSSEANTDSPVEENAVPTIPTPTAPAPPVLPRAVAPPVGDIAVSNIDSTPDMIDLGTEVLVPRLVVKDAPAREVLAVLARFAGLNLVFTDQAQPSQPSGGGGEGAEGAAAAAPTGGSGGGGPTISLDLEDEPVQEVFNSVLMVSGLNANRRGNTIFVGPSLPDTARNLISRTLRLNQVQANAASTFLASQGAEVQQIVTPVQEVVDPETQRVVRRDELPPQLQPLSVAQAEGSMAPLLLNGLKVSTDDRLNSITLVGEPRKVEIATSFLTQLDARRRQVSVNVKVIDVNLLNTDDFNTSFSFGINDTFFAQDQGTAILNFGENSPPNAAQVRGSSFSPAIVPLQSTIVNGESVELAPFLDRQNNAPFGNTTPGTTDFPFSGTSVPFARPNFGTNSNPFQPGLSDVNFDINSETGQVEDLEFEYTLPSLFQFPQKFLLNLEAQVQSGNAKILTDPTLTVQEGQEATVRLVQNVVTSVQTEIDAESGVRTVEPVLGEAGLVLNVNVERIDDNGFVNLSVSPVVSAIGNQQVFESGGGAENVLNLLNRRELSSGLIRLRDGQTLILSGIIQESDQTTVSKVPILGDIPILGALFRSTNKSNERREVIVLLTPQIVDERSDFGYNYVPGQDAREMMRQRGLTVPGNP